MTTNHIDQLKEWWDEATPGIPKTGDTYIEDERHRGSSFRIVEAAADHKYGFDNIRILARAPKPKPAWHDAVAVIAETGDDDTRRAFVPQYNAETGDERLGTWADWQGGYDASELIDPAPLIEAKVADEMVERLEGHFLNTANMALPEGLARRMLHAALGLETA